MARVLILPAMLLVAVLAVLFDRALMADLDTFDARGHRL